jgi:hypothetical protein
MGAISPRKRDARKDDTREIRTVFLYASGYFLWNLRI